MEEKHVRLTHLDKALDLTRKGDFQIVFYLVSAYHHIRIKEEQTQFLGVRFEEEDGSICYGEFRVLPFGLASAVHAITKVFKPIISYISSIGIRCSIFIDDGQILADTPESIETARKAVYSIVQQAGWAIS